MLKAVNDELDDKSSTLRSWERMLKPGCVPAMCDNCGVITVMRCSKCNYTPFCSVECLQEPARRHDEVVCGWTVPARDGKPPEPEWSAVKGAMQDPYLHPHVQTNLAFMRSLVWQLPKRAKDPSPRRFQADPTFGLLTQFWVNESDAAQVGRVLVESRDDNGYFVLGGQSFKGYRDYDRLPDSVQCAIA